MNSSRLCETFSMQSLDVLIPCKTLHMEDYNVHNLTSNFCSMPAGGHVTSVTKALVGKILTYWQYPSFHFVFLTGSKYSIQKSINWLWD